MVAFHFIRFPPLAMQLAEIGALVRSRRDELGLSQERLAHFSGLSRVTINQLERGTLKDLGIAKLIALTSILGIALSATLKPARSNGLFMASVTSGVSHRERLDERLLSGALGCGVVPAGFRPQIASLINEAPLEILVKAVEESARKERVAPKKIWGHIHQWARELQSPRRELLA